MFKCDILYQITILFFKYILCHFIIYHCILSLVQVPELVDSVQQALDVYYDLQSNTVDYFEYFFQNDDPTRPLPVSLSVDSYKQGPGIFDLSLPFDNTLVTREYELQSTADLGPFSPDRPDLRDGNSVNTYIHYLYAMRLNFRVRNYELSDSVRICYRWAVQLAYDFSVRGRIVMDVSTDTQLCPEERRSSWYSRAIPTEVFLNIALVFLAAISQALHLKATYRSMVIFQEARLASRPAQEAAAAAAAAAEAAAQAKRDKREAQRQRARERRRARVQQQQQQQQQLRLMRQQQQLAAGGAGGDFSLNNNAGADGSAAGLVADGSSAISYQNEAEANAHNETLIGGNNNAASSSFSLQQQQQQQDSESNLAGYNTTNGYINMSNIANDGDVNTTGGDMIGNNNINGADFGYGYGGNGSVGYFNDGDGADADNEYSHVRHLHNGMHGLGDDNEEEDEDEDADAEADAEAEAAAPAAAAAAETSARGLTAWGDLSLRDKLRFFNMWFVLATIGNVCNLVGPLLALQTQVTLHSDRTRLYFLGLGCMMAWVNVVQYFEGAASYYVLITTLRKGMPRVARFLIGVLPVFLGYAMFGVAFFSTASDNFATVDAACVTLFSLLNGDVVHDIFDDLYVDFIL